MICGYPLPDAELVDHMIPPLEKDKETILILAGDICNSETAIFIPPFLARCEERFREVLYIPGNHEYYGGTLLHLAGKITKMIEDKNLRTKFAEQQVIKFEDEKVAFVMAILWTDMDRGNPIAMYNVRNGLNDYRRISDGRGHTIIPEYIVAEFNKNKAYLMEHVPQLQQEGYKVVVVTHHAPSHQSNVGYEGSKVTFGFVSAMDEDVLDLHPHLWIHGHCHAHLDYKIGETRVVCNAHGYPRESFPGPKYNPTLVLEA